MRKKRRKKNINKILIPSLIGVLIAAIIIVTGIIILREKPPSPPGKKEVHGLIPIRKPSVAGEELLIKGCLFDLGIPKDHVRITGRTIEVTLAKPPVASHIEKAFAALRTIEGVEVSLKEPTRLAVIINEKEWTILFHSMKVPEKVVAQVAIIIDDMGQDMVTAQRLSAINSDLTFSVLPHERHTEEVAGYLHKHGKEVLLHLPMEGSNGNNPGPGAIYHDTEPLQAQMIFKESLANVPMADGVNNHMGSVVTQNDAIMRALFSSFNEKGLFYIDSLTTDKSVCHAIAAEVNLPFQKRDVFLDNNQNYQYIAGQIQDLVNIAKRQGEAIAICHPHSVTVDVLVHEVPLLREKGIEVVRVSKLVSEHRLNAW